MTREEALQVLTRHNEWRRGAEIPMDDPKEIGEAIDIAISALKEKKDPSLTWKDIQAIVSIEQDLNNEEATIGPERKNQEHYQEVLNRFIEQQIE